MGEEVASTVISERQRLCSNWTSEVVSKSSSEVALSALPFHTDANYSFELFARE